MNQGPHAAETPAWADTTRLSVLEADWPAADRALLAGLLTPGELFEEQGALAHLKPVSVRNIVIAYGRWLAWLACVAPAALEEPPAARATPERFHAWLLSESGLAPASRHTLGSQTLRLLKAADPRTDRSQHARVLHGLWAEVTNHRSPRKDGRIVSSAVLLEAALERSVDLGQGRPVEEVRTAIARRDAAMVALLAVLPIRRRAFCGLAIDTSFRVSGSGSTAGMRVVLDREMTKNAQPWEAPVPDVLDDIMTDYLEHVRPVLLARGVGQTSHLWLNDSGRPYFPIHWAARIRNITEDLVGVRVTPHMFRDCAATTLATSSPAHARLIRALLGHTTFRTGEKHYNQAQGIEAGRRHAELIARLGGKHL